MHHESVFAHCTILAVGAAFIGSVYCSAGAAQKTNATKEVPAPTVEMSPIDIKLPPPFFGGTPLTYSNDHFEGKIFTPRPPFPAPNGAVNLSQGKPVASSAPDPAFGKLSMITDGEKGYQNEFLTELKPGPQWVQIDLGQPCDIYAIIVWHYHANERVYYDVVVRVANDADCKDTVTLYNNDYDNSSGFGIGKDKEYLESNEGRLVPALKDGKGILGRYVRLSTKGNTSDDANHYVEVEVWGKPHG